MLTRLIWVLAAAWLAGAQAAPARTGLAADEPSVRVVVTVPPLKGLVEPLLPAGSVLTLLIPPGVSEHGYEAPPRVLAELARADVVVLVGLGLEPQVEKFLAAHERAGRRVVRFADAAGVALGAAEHGEDADHAGHAHDEHGECVHSVDPHLWLDPVKAKVLVQAAGEAIGAALAAQPGGAATKADVTQRAEGLLAQLDGLDRAYAARLGAAPRRTIVVTHDAFGWLAGRYRFETVAIKGLNAGEPTPRALEDAVAAVKRHGLTAVFAEPQLSPAMAQRVAEATGVKVLTLDPLGDGDYFALMLKNLDALADAMGVPGEVPGGRGVLAEPRRTPAKGGGR